MRTIGNLAAFVTSTSAGSFLLTLDIVFPAAVFPIHVLET